MPRSIARSVRYAFLALSASLLLTAGVQSLGRGEPRMGLSTCGWEGNPCVLDELVITAPPAAAPEPGGLIEVARPVDHVSASRTEPADAQS